MHKIYIYILHVKMITNHTSSLTSTLPCIADLFSSTLRDVSGII